MEKFLITDIHMDKNKVVFLHKKGKITLSIAGPEIKGKLDNLFRSHTLQLHGSSYLETDPQTGEKYTVSVVSFKSVYGLVSFKWEDSESSFYAKHLTFEEN